jgi:hypothetical protein
MPESAQSLTLCLAFFRSRGKGKNQHRDLEEDADYLQLLIHRG